MVLYESIVGGQLREQQITLGRDDQFLHWEGSQSAPLLFLPSINFIVNVAVVKRMRQRRRGCIMYAADVAEWANFFFSIRLAGNVRADF